MSTATARITLDEYHAMAEQGLLRPDSKDYLWDGEIVQVMTQKPPHISASEAIADCLRDIYPRAEWTIREERPLPLPGDSEPIPDVVVLRGPKSAFKGRYPRPDEVELLVEVSQSSKKKDLGKKLRGYAAAAIARYWVVDIDGEVILAFWDPEPQAGRYRSTAIYVRGQAAETPNGLVPVDDVFANVS